MHKMIQVMFELWIWIRTSSIKHFQHATYDVETERKEAGKGKSEINCSRKHRFHFHFQRNFTNIFWHCFYRRVMWYFCYCHRARTHTRENFNQINLFHFFWRKEWKNYRQAMNRFDNRHIHTSHFVRILQL